MDIFEKIFGKIHNFLEGKLDKQTYTYPQDNRLSLLAKILFKKNYIIKFSDIKTGLDDQFLYLPPSCSFFDEIEKNKLFFEFRIFLFYALSNFYGEKKSGEDFETPLNSLPRSWSFLKREFPGIEEKFNPILPSDDFKKYINGEIASINPKKGTFYCGAFYDPEKPTPSSDFQLGKKNEGKDYSLETQGHAEITEVKKKKDGAENPLVHNFEKLKTAEEYFGGEKTFDGSDEMQEQLDAIKDLKWNKVVRTPEKSESFLKINLSRDSDGIEIINNDEISSKGLLYKYPEYNFKKKQNIQDWCHVYETKIPNGHDISKHDEHRKTIERLKSELIYRIFSRRIRNRQLNGEQIDLDALVDFHADLKHGGIVSDKLYLKKKNTFQDISIFFLLDLSQSMDSWKDRKRILDVATDGLWILGEVFSDLVPNMGIGGFYSLTRKNCQFKIIKSFEESWGIGRNKVFNLQTEGHTRIGPALRHAQSILNKTNSKRRILILLTDGKPIDYDRYEGIYGEKDIQMAISEGKSNGVSTFAFAFEKDSNQSFIKMFGRNCFEIVSKPSQIGEKFLDFLTSKE